MPKLPDLVVYLERLSAFVGGQTLTSLRLGNPFILRSVNPPVSQVVGTRLLGFHRLGKRLVIELEHECFIVIHLMIAGRLHWRPPRATIPKGYGLAALDFPTGTVLLSEGGKVHRASLQLVQGHTSLAALNPGGLEVLAADLAIFGDRIRSDNHTLKRVLTDPHILSGIGNSYSDEILHRARLSPIRQTRSLSNDEIARFW